MRPRRTHLSTNVYRLEGGTEDNDLWTTLYGPADGGPAIGSTWEPTVAERAAIANGANIELLVFGDAQPPVNVRLSEYPLGKAPTEPPA